ncbi:---NA--- [Paramuricea clavata]|uniref:---NA n=1 Tax=Paramuricea clavata TaxID=317549 RepID=A0A6S7G6A9_PARCT|nr:---NA--- [Paramuricea clavata]
MIGLIFAVIFGLDILLFSPCEGQISLSPGGDTFVVLPGENVSIAWKLNVSITDVLGRWWTFLPKNEYLFADIIRDGNVIEFPQYSPGPFTITKPSTLILKNVTIQCNGTYTFSILAKGKPIAASNVTVFVAGKCHLGEGGNPPANVTWYKDDVQIGRTGNEEQTLTLRNVGGTDSRTYKCVAQSHTLVEKKLVEVKVRQNSANKEDDETTVAVWHIVVFLVSGIMIGTLLSYIVFCSRRKFRSRKPQSKPEPKTTEVDTTYQELDLSKMNTEDNYQSLRVNAASLYDAGNQTANDEESTYTELSKTRDVENNYQSLTYIISR